MKKYLFILVGVIALPLFSITAEAKESLISQSLNAFLQAKAVHVTGYANVTEYSSNSFLTSPASAINNTSTYSVTFDAKHDYLTPGSLKADQSVTIKETTPGATLLSGGFDPFTNLTVGSKIIGSDVYIQIPTALLTLFSDNPDKSGGSIWVRINKSDIEELNKDFPGIKDVYDSVTELNDAPTKFVKEKQVDWNPFINSFQLKKLSTKMMNGSNVNIYSFTLNKTLLRNALIAKAKKEGLIGYDLAYETKKIDNDLKTTRIRQGYFLTYANTLLPHSASFIVDSLNDKGKVSSSVDFRINFSDYDMPITVSAPDKFITAKQFYDKYIKSAFDGMFGSGSGLEAARDKGADAAMKANLANFRATAELLYDENGTSYGATNNGSCISPKSGSVFNPTSKNFGADARDTIDNIINESSNAKCYSSATAWAMSAKLNSTNEYFCADSTGNAKSISKQITGTSCDK